MPRNEITISPVQSLSHVSNITAVRRQRPTVEDAISSLLDTIESVSLLGENHPVSRARAIETVNMIKTGDAADMIRENSQAYRQRLQEQENLQNAITDIFNRG
jgi:hypothetical protein